MLRNVDLSEISDGKLYDANDMVKADCKGCEGCSACCRGMGTSIVLDPLDIHRLTTGLGIPFEALLSRYIELNVVDGLILPNLKMTGDEESCLFLNEEGRCSIHAFRPGICRLFPLGRFYEDGSFRYFLQTQECPKPAKAKIKVYKWLDTEDIRTYEQFIRDWHYFLKDIQELTTAYEDPTQVRAACMYILEQFYLAPCEDFYESFQARLEKAKKHFGL